MKIIHLQKNHFSLTIKPKIFYKKVSIQKTNIDNSISNHFKSGSSNPSSSLSIQNNNKLYEILNPQSKFLNNQAYIIHLDNKKLKTRHLDELLLPNILISLAIAEEWSQQVGFINYYSMHIYNLHSNAINILNDEYIREMTIKKISLFFNTDQFLYINSIKLIEKLDDYFKTNLQQRVVDICSYWEKRFNKTLKFHGYEHDNFLSTTLNEKEFSSLPVNDVGFLLENTSPFVLSLFECMCGFTKSIIISFALMENVISHYEAYLLSHSEELYQMIENGEVEGHHDLLHKSVLGNLYSSKIYYDLLRCEEKDEGKY